jgi:tryptophanyl-tRNA synthetase
MRILSGIQSSGKLHLGNYFGALRQFVELQAQGEAIYFIADLHALTSVRHGPTLRGFGLDVALDYLACGLDPEKATMFCQSDVSEHAELAWVLSTVTPMAYLERAHSYKDKTARGIAADAGLFTYPVLMAADILLYGADRVPVGQDQRQHLELARDICTKFNVTYVEGYSPQDPKGERGGVPGILKLPEALILDSVAQVPGVDGQKMSKSYHNTIDLFGEEKFLRKRMMSIVTDSTPIEAAKPQPAALLCLLQLLADADEGASLKKSWEAGGVGYGTYKKRLVELYFTRFAMARQRRAELSNNLDYVEAVLTQGAQRARQLLAPTWEAVVSATGLGRRRRTLGACSA